MAWWPFTFKSRQRPSTRCDACGGASTFSQHDVLWPELIAEWELSPEWTRWFDAREGLACDACGSNLRSNLLARAILRAVRQETGRDWNSLRAAAADSDLRNWVIAEINAAGRLHPILAQLPSLHYSEFATRAPGVRSEDLAQLSYADDFFDLVLTSDTLEHVPDLPRALAEIGRVLKPGGLHIFTAPVVWDRPSTRTRARMDGQNIVHVLPPSFHGSTHAREFLVFREFGADLPATCAAAGFQVTVLQEDNNPAAAAFITRKAPATAPVD